MMSEAQRRVLKSFLERPIAYFDVDTDESKKSIVWQYFGELAYRDPETGKVLSLIHISEPTRPY